MTDLERESLYALGYVVQHFSARTISLAVFTEGMGIARNTLQKLENKALGCASGLHAGHCTCKEGKPGVCTRG